MASSASNKATATSAVDADSATHETRDCQAAYPPTGGVTRFRYLWKLSCPPYYDDREWDKVMFCFVFLIGGISKVLPFARQIAAC